MNLSEDWLILAGGSAAALMVMAWAADHRRMRRAELDRVGCMPWTGVFFLSLFAAVFLLGAAAKAWVSG